MFHQSLPSIQPDNIMSAPVLKCIAKDQREKDGYKSFKAWIDDPKNVYIGPHLHKYVKNYNGKESMWMNPYQAHFPKAEANKLFENFIRSQAVLYNCIPSLTNTVLGCWCEPLTSSNVEVSECHGDVLIKLYNEYVTTRCFA
jgi:hypothetical protein